MRNAWAIYILCLAAAVPAAAAREDQVVARYRIVVEEFEDSKDNANPLETEVITTLIRAALANDSRVAVLERKEMARLFDDLSQSQRLPQIFDPNSATRRGRILQANYVVVGSVARGDDSTTIVATIVDVETSVQKRTATLEFADESLTVICNRIAKDLLRFLPPERVQPKSGSVTVEVSPSEAQVRFDLESQVLDLPIRQHQLGVGRHRLEVIPTDRLYSRRFVDFEIVAGQETVLKVELARRLGRIRFTVPRLPVAVYLDGEFLGSNPQEELPVAAGLHSLTIVDSSGRTKHREVFVEPEVPALVVDLERRFEDLSANAQEHFVRQISSSSDVEAAYVGDEIIFLRSASGDLTAYDADTLELRRVYKGLEVVEGPVEAGMIVVVVEAYRKETSAGGGHSTGRGGSGGSAERVKSMHRRIVVLDSASGEIIDRSIDVETESAALWSGEHTAAIRLGQQWFAVSEDERRPRAVDMPLPPTGRLAAVSDWGIFSWSVTGHILRGVSLEDGFRWEKVLDGRARLSVACDGRVVVGLDDGTILGLEETTGAIVWKAEAGSEGRWLGCAGGSVYFVDEMGGLVVVARSGSVVRNSTIPLLDRHLINGIQVDDTGLLSVILADYRLALFDSRTETHVWALDSLERIRGAFFGDNLLIVIGWEGQIAAFARPRASRITGWLDRVRGDAGSSEAIIADDLPSDMDFVAASVSIDGEFEPVVPLRVSQSTEVGPDRYELEFQDGVEDLRPGQVLYAAGVVEVDVEPSDAVVLLDGRYARRGSGSIRGVTPGGHRLYFAAPKHFSEDRTISVGEGLEEVAVRLLPLADGMLEIRASPVAADVFVDGSFRTRTPGNIHGLSVGQSVEVRVRAEGFRDYIERVVVGREAVEIRAVLQEAWPMMTLNVAGGSSSVPVLVGWSNDSIRAREVVGDGVRSATGAQATAAAQVSLRMGRVFPFIATSGTLGRDGAGEEAWYAGGLLVQLQDLFSRVPVRVGVSYRVQLAEESAAPSDGRGGTQADAPLEDWRHPIPGVFVANEPRRSAFVHFEGRLLRSYWVRVGVGLPISGTLAGTALVSDGAPDGSLVRSTDRSYSFDVESGRMLELEVHAPLRPWLSWVPTSTNLYAGYRSRMLDFGVAEERGWSWGIGLSISGLWK